MTNYNVLLTGEPSGDLSRDAAIEAFAKYAGISSERARAMFDSAPTVVKRDVPQELALAYQKKLAEFGVGTEIQSVSAESSAAAQGPAASESDAVQENAAAPQSTTAPQSTAPQASAETGTGKRHVGFKFSGNGYEYFKIWIVNILLTIVTLGLYAPWAKVRNKQYFYGNTSLDGSTFSFTADPVKMLIGRLIALGLFIVYIATFEFFPLLAIPFMIAMIFVFPWVMNRTLIFYARNSSYRNIRFRFVGSYGDALGVFIGWQILASLTLGLLGPFALFKQQEYIASNHRYGNKSFAFSASAGEYYKLTLIAIGIALLGGIVGGILAAVIVGVLGMGISAFAFALPVIGYALGLIYFVTGMKNVFFNNLSLSSHDFKARYEVKSFGWVMASNFVLMLVTLGLFIPWAKVRVAQYAAEHTAMDVTGDLDKFAAISQPDESAFGEELGDVFDMEVGF